MVTGRRFALTGGCSAFGSRIVTGRSVETTSFAALVARLGVAIGAAWGGLLSNFAAGVFILVLRPFKVGDYTALVRSTRHSKYGDSRIEIHWDCAMKVPE